MSIEVSHLVKQYGQQKAVDGISFSVKKNEIVGFLGPNGAGKSTTLKMSTGYVTPTSGTVEITGIDVSQHPIEIKQKIGYLPEHNPLYLDMFVHEYLHFSGKFFGIKVIPQWFYDVGYQDMSFMVLAPGAFIVIGLLVWLAQSIVKE